MSTANLKTLVSVAATLHIVGSVATAQTTLNGNSFALRSTGTSSGQDWTLSSNGYLGTYIQMAAPGIVSFNVQAAGVSSPRMSLAVGDSQQAFNVTTGFNNYSNSLSLPAGTHFVRLQYDNDAPAAASRALTVRNLQVSGASISNASTNANALAVADTYIANYRKGNTTLALTGPGGIPLLGGQSVNVDLARHAFNFGTAVPGVDAGGVNSYLGSGSTKQSQYQARLNQNFNTIVPENAGKWAYNESTRDNNTMAGVDQILNYAQARHMRTRMHNLIWGDNSNNGQQPAWVLNNNAAPNNGLLDKASLGDLTAKNDLRTEISERIGYYIGSGTPSDRAKKYVEIDIYNESHHTGAGAPAALNHNYWNVYGPTGIADIYRESIQAVAASGATAKVFLNEYNVLDDGAYANYYVQNIEAVRNAGIAAGYGDVVQGIGAQYYPSAGTHNAAKAMANFQNLSVQGLPISLTEFGAQSSLTTTDGANILGEMLRLTFGNAQSTGFSMWGFHQESGTGATTLFAPQSALYTVNTADFNTWTITDAGKKWQDQLGIVDWDGNTSNGWSTHLSQTVNADGSITFNGFYGDYNIGNQSGFANFTHAKGTGPQSLQLAAPPNWYFWKPTNSGTWSSGTNWSNAVAGGIGHTAHFAQAAGARTVTLASDVTLGQINFGSTSSYIVEGPATMTLDAIAGRSAMNVVSGQHTISTQIVLADDTRVWIAAANGLLTITKPIDAPERNLEKQGPGTLNVTRIALNALDIAAGTVVMNAGSGTSVIRSLDVGVAATLDVNDAILVVDYTGSSPLAALTQSILTARDNGTWEGDGITSQLAITDSRYSVAIGEVAALADAAAITGTSVDATSLIIRSTFLGDATMDGAVNFDDLLILAQNYDTGSNNTWTDGDSNYDGVVNFDDLLSLAQVYGQTVGAVSTSSIDFHTDWTLARSLVPEPSLLVAGMIAALVRRVR